MEILNVFEAKILVVSVALLVNDVVTSDINCVVIAVGRSCVDFDSVILVNKTAKTIEFA